MRKRKSYKLAPGQSLDEGRVAIYERLIRTEPEGNMISISATRDVKWDELFSVIQQKEVFFLSLQSFNFVDEEVVQEFLENLSNNTTLTVIYMERPNNFLMTPQYFSQLYSICYSHARLRLLGIGVEGNSFKLGKNEVYDRNILVFNKG
jgi:hypothetical protein